MSVTLRAATTARPGIDRVHLRLHGPVLRLNRHLLPPRHERITRPGARIVRHAVQARIIAG